MKNGIVCVAALLVSMAMAGCSMTEWHQNQHRYAPFAALAQQEAERDKEMYRLSVELVAWRTKYRQEAEYNRRLEKMIDYMWAAK